MLSTQVIHHSKKVKIVTGIDFQKLLMEQNHHDCEKNQRNPWTNDARYEASLLIRPSC